jgi:hypothetical protein
LHSVLFLIFIQKARNKLCSDATHAQIVCQNILSTAIQYSYFICNFSNSQSVISMDDTTDINNFFFFFWFLEG